MRRPNSGDILTGILVACAMITTALVVRREIFATPSSAQSTTLAERNTVFLRNWREAFTVGTRIGSAQAPIQIIEFADFQCPYCAKYEKTLRNLRAKYLDKVAVTFAHFPLVSHQHAELAARAADCANDQGRFEEMRSFLFMQQRELGKLKTTDMAAGAGVPDASLFQECVNSAASTERVAKSKQIGDAFGINATPTVIVNGWKMATPPPMVELERMAQLLLDGKSPVPLTASLAAADESIADEP